MKTRAAMTPLQRRPIAPEPISPNHSTHFIGRNSKLEKIGRPHQITLDNRQFRAIALSTAMGLAVLLGGGTEIGAASLSVSDPEIVAYFSFNKGQTPEAIAVEPDGAVDISLADASTAVRVAPDGQVVPLGQLARSGNCPVIGHPTSAGIARDYDGAVLLVNCTGNVDTGVWRLRRGSAPVQIASLPPNSFPHNIALDEWSGSLYVTDSVLGVVWRSPPTVAHQRPGRRVPSFGEPRSSAPTVLQSIAAPSG
jgi:streptogramin lyase